MSGLGIQTSSLENTRKYKVNQINFDSLVKQLDKFEKSSHYINIVASENTQWILNTFKSISDQVKGLRDNNANRYDQVSNLSSYVQSLIGINNGNPPLGKDHTGFYAYMELLKKILHLLNDELKKTEALQKITKSSDRDLGTRKRESVTVAKLNSPNPKKAIDVSNKSLTQTKKRDIQSLYFPSISKRISLFEKKYFPLRPTFNDKIQAIKDQLVKVIYSKNTILRSNHLAELGKLVESQIDKLPDDSFQYGDIGNEYKHLITSIASTLKQSYSEMRKVYNSSYLSASKH